MLHMASSIVMIALYKHGKLVILNIGLVIAVLRQEQTARMDLASMLPGDCGI